MSFFRFPSAPARALMLTVVLSACGVGGTFSPDQESVPSAVAPPSLGLSGDTRKALDDFLGYLATLLPCSMEEYVSKSASIGANGGTIKMGNHRIVIPKGALSGKVTITAEVVPGLVNSVRLSPHGLQFARPATLIMNYSNCQQVGAAKSIAYTDEQLNVLEKLKSADAPKAFEVAAPLDHFSRYAVAW